MLACTLEDKGSASFHFDRAAFAINRRWEARLSFWMGVELDEVICPLTVTGFAWDPGTESSSFWLVGLRRQPCHRLFSFSEQLPVLLPEMSLNMYVPREGHPEDSSFVMLQWGKDIIGERFPWGCDVHTRHLEPLQALKPGVYRIREGRPHLERGLGDP